MMQPEPSAAERAAWWVLAATVILSALAAVPAGDTFRLPKDAVLRAGAMVLLTIAALETIWSAYAVLFWSSCAKAPG